jgi:hypothetical protein
MKRVREGSSRGAREATRRPPPRVQRILIMTHRGRCRHHLLLLLLASLPRPIQLAIFPCKTSCIGDARSVVWYVALTANIVAARMPDHGSSSVDCRYIESSNDVSDRLMNTLDYGVGLWVPGCNGFSFQTIVVGTHLGVFGHEFGAAVEAYSLW